MKVCNSKQCLHTLNKEIFPDIVVFINGLPVAVIEAKSPFKEGGEFVKAGKKDAFDQLRRYMDVRGGAVSEGAERLFHTNFITVIINANFPKSSYSAPPNWCLKYA